MTAQKGDLTVNQNNKEKNNTKFNNSHSFNNSQDCFNNYKLNHSLNTINKTTTNNHYHFNIDDSGNHHNTISQRKRKYFITDTIDHILNPNKRQRIENWEQSMNNNKNVNTHMQNDYVPSVNITN